MSPGDSLVLFRALPIYLKISKEDRQSLADFASTLSQAVAGSRPFTCLITSNHALRKLNREFLGHDYATDVLSFPAEAARDDEPSLGPAEAAGDEELSLGDLAISIQMADKQAGDFGHSRLDEVRVLMLHGLLHLLGFDHEVDRGRMARAERKWRLHFGLPCSVIARANQGLAS